MSKISVIVKIIDSNGKELKSFTENIDPMKTMQSIKSIFANKITEQIQSIQFNGQTVIDGNNAKYYDIKDGSVLYVVCSGQENCINLMVEVQSANINQRTFQLRVSENITTEKLMTEIKNKANFNMSSAYLTCKGEQLRDGISLYNQNIRNNDSICVLMRTKGG